MVGASDGVNRGGVRQKDQLRACQRRAFLMKDLEKFGPLEKRKVCRSLLVWRPGNEKPTVGRNPLIERG
jgi:hypothetical protein